MRSHRLAGLIGASTLAAAVALPLPAAHAADAGTLYVDKYKAACTDQGTGTQAQPFCHVQAGVDAAKPGDTVSIGGGSYPETVTVTHSGEPGKPVTITGRMFTDESWSPTVVGSSTGSQPSIVLDGVHDVVVQNLRVASSAEAFLVRDSAAIVLDHHLVTRSTDATAPLVRLTGATKDVRISRSWFDNGSATAVQVGQGVQGAVVSTNVLYASGATAVQVTDAPGTVVTSNTAFRTCSTAIALSGDSHGSTVENNVVAPGFNLSCPQGTTPSVSVSAASATDTRYDYNLVSPIGSATPYSWAGTTYPTAAGLLAATGQGKHELYTDAKMGASQAPQSDSPQVDSADAEAPGELSTDVYGHHRGDDPNVPDTGNGTGSHDRGAMELTSLSSVTVSTTPHQGPAPLSVTPTVRLQTNWTSPQYSYLFDFGDGSAPVTSSDAAVPHVYQSPGSYVTTVRVTDDQGNSVQSWGVTQVKENGPLVAAFTAKPNQQWLRYQYSFNAWDSTSPWQITKYHFDFGDGTRGVDSDPGSSTVTHVFGSSTPVTVKLTVTDEGGRTASVEQRLTPSYAPSGYTAITPARILDTRQGWQATRLGNGGQADIGFGDGNMGCAKTPANVPAYATALVVNVTAVNPSTAGYLTVWADHSGRPATSNLNFKAGQTVANLVTVPVVGGMCPQLHIFNFSGGADVVADVQGYYLQDFGARFTTTAPTRLLDTRHTAGYETKGLGADEQYVLKTGLPKGTTAAVLNVTAVNPTAGGYLSVTPVSVRHPGTSNINFTVGQTVANQVIVPVDADGNVGIYNRFGNTHVVADLMGYYSPTGDSFFTPVSPTRLVDTRKPSPLPLGQGGTLAVPTGAPAGATGAVLNVTSTGSTNGGYLTVWADGATKPGTSSVNFGVGQTVPNHVTTPLGANGSFDVYNFAGRTHVIADLFGYFTKP
ncbi:PKD domain-containing protein [Kitasatospora sp. NPDC002227]|uniref:PKD domain-containing protein n=1 Tax=Kitasatospora sp. NPDC002227 TaxID=3154773 RepID=UPI0033246DDD